MYSFLSWLLRILPLSTSQKSLVKSAVYRHIGWLMKGSTNYGIWLKQQGLLNLTPLAPPPTEPTPAQWDRLRERLARATNARPPPGAPYVVIPVYRGRAETLACLFSVLTADPATEVVVINDASPDERLAERLREFALDGLIRLEKNDRNLGFALTANLGMGLFPDRDVVLLNSDTEVYGDWLARLARLAHSDPAIGTVTPLSNNAEVCSYPFWLQDNSMQLELDYAELDHLASEANAGHVVETPTAVGFCMYIRRDCLSEVGAFDERFAQGYGEENDFSLRATELGWKHVIAGEIFVRHVGGVSFGRQARRRRAHALHLLRERFPDYEARIDAYIRADPVEPIRRRLDVARLERADASLPDAAAEASKQAVLFATHDWGGGVEHNVRNMADALATEGVPVYILRPSTTADEPLVAKLSRMTEVAHTPSLDAMPIAGAPSRLYDALCQLGISHIHVHHLGGYGDLAIREMKALANALGCAYDVTLHDFAPVCPRLHLSIPNGRYCGEPADAECDRCIEAHGSPFGLVSIADWRTAWREGLAEARLVYHPTQDARLRVQRHFPRANYAFRPHLEPPGTQATAGAVSRLRRAGPTTRVAIPGAIGHQKGFDLILECARDARARALPLSFCVVGYTIDDRAARAAGIEVSGEFDAGEADMALSRAECDLAFIPSMSPESYSFVLSSALRIGLFPVVFDLGGLAERVRAAGWGEILPVDMMSSAAEVNDRLLNCAPPPPRPAESGIVEHRYSTLVDDYYENFRC